MAPTRSAIRAPLAPYQRPLLRHSWTALLVAEVAGMSFTLCEPFDLDGLALALLARAPVSNPARTGDVIRAPPFDDPVSRSISQTFTSNGASDGNGGEFMQSKIIYGLLCVATILACTNRRC